MLHNAVSTTLTRPADAPIQLDRRLSWIDALIHLAGGAACMLMSWLLLLVVGWATDKPDWTVATWVSLVLGGSFGCVFGFAGVFLIGGVAVDLVLSVQFRRDWHAQLIWERQQTGGEETYQQYSESTFLINNPSHFILACLAVYVQSRRGDTRLSIDKMRRIQLADDGGLIELGDMPEQQARAFLDVLAQNHLLVGRKERVGGRLDVENADELLDAIIPLARRLNRRSEL